MYALQESDRCVVPVKQPNKEGQPSAEAAEGRRQPKENDAQSSTSPTQSGERVSQGLSGVRRVARERKQEQFTALLHHVTVNLLRESFDALKKNAAPGVDGVTWREYEMGLEDRLIDLHSRVHRGTYRAQPSRRVYIPKADGRQRPLGIAALEDKIVQQAVVTVLNEIYETDFRGFSYGFRPGRNPHQALDALNAGLQKKRVNWVLDADIKGFFDHVSHEWLLKFIGHRVADNRMLRLIQKWLKAGVSEEGEWSETTVGTPQGAVASPLLANVYLHYVFDLWVEVWREKIAQGDMIVVRYADDLVAGFQHQADAERFLRDFQERLAKFGLEIHPEKTRLIEFGRFAASDRRKRRARETGNIHVPRVHALLWHELEGPLCGLAAYGGKADEGKAPVPFKQELRRMMHEPVAHRRGVAETGGGGLLPLPRRAGQPVCARAVSRTALPLLAACSTPSQSAAEARLGSTAADLRPMDSSPSYSSSLSRYALRRSYPREEPYAVIPHVRICAGGDQRWSSLPQSIAEG